MTDTASTLRLRPHHLLCLQTFVGRGYSEDFVGHMTEVKRQLTADPRTPITLVRGADELCAHCPNCVSGKCTSDNPALFDRLVVKKLTASEQYSELSSDSGSQHLCGIPEELRMSQELLDECCPGCEWKELCEEIVLHKWILEYHFNS